MRKRETRKKVRIPLTLDEATFTRLNKIAELSGESMSTVVTIILATHIIDLKENSPKKVKRQTKKSERDFLKEDYYGTNYQS